MSDKRWTYEYFTTRITERIVTLIDLAKAAAGEEDGYGTARAFYYKAEGVFEAWCAVVGGERRKDDTDRLRACLDSVKPHIE